MANLGAQSNDDQVSLFLNRRSSLMWKSVNDGVWHGYDKGGELQSVVVINKPGSDQSLFGCLVRGEFGDITTPWTSLNSIAEFLEVQVPKGG